MPKRKLLAKAPLRPSPEGDRIDIKTVGPCQHSVIQGGTGKVSGLAERRCQRAGRIGDNIGKIQLGNQTVAKAQDETMWIGGTQSEDFALIEVNVSDIRGIHLRIKVVQNGSLFKARDFKGMLSCNA